MRSMLAPQSAIRPAIADMAAARSGAPSTVTCERPEPRSRLSPTPRSTSTCMPREDAVSSMASRSFFQSRGAVMRTPRTRRRRSTICSMSTTSTPAAARVANIADVTPGRSLPVRVTRRVLGCSSTSVISRPRLSPPAGVLRTPATPRASRPPRPRDARPARGGERVAPARDLVRRQGTAVVLQRQVDDRPSLEPAGGQVGAAGRHAERRLERGPVPQVHQPVGHLGPPPGDVELGEQVGRVDEGGAQGRSASPTSGSWRGADGSTCQRTTSPTTVGTSANDASTTASPESTAAVVEARGGRPARAGRPRPGARARPGRHRRGGRRRRRRAASYRAVGDVLEALDHVPEIAVGDCVEHVVGDLVAAQPGGQPPREAGGEGEFE